ncbi:hypothetical protein Ae201684_000462 [Aphanomyces euteiches]|uniref:Uncharacterized protein n=1 Tax=Aphanomyces euteiches TaxID=100861 RepID=A0A6G0XY92_9STRA|nr:hypothetical protein Ae201684_000462 [Aphanomyces euteiches]
MSADSAGSDDFKGYDYATLKRLHLDLIQRRTKRGVKSIRTPRGYFLLATKFAKKEPLPLHLVTKEPNFNTDTIAANVAGYLDPNIQTYIRRTWWPMAHYNPITFKKNKNIDLTKDDYVRFNCKVYRALLPDITYAEAIRRIEKDWRDDILLGGAFSRAQASRRGSNGSRDNDKAPVESPPESTNDSMTPVVESASTSGEIKMDFNMFSLSLLDLATSCSAGGMDALYLFLQFLRVKMKSTRDFEDLPKPKYCTEILDHPQPTILVEHGKVYTEDITEEKRSPLTATLYQVGLFPTRLPLLTLFFSLDSSPMDFYVKAIDSSQPMNDESNEWTMANVPAAALVFKTSADDVTSIKYETLESFVLPVGTRSDLADASFQMTYVLQEVTPLEFEGTFFGSVAAKRVRIFGLHHPQGVDLILTLTTEPTRSASVHPEDKKHHVIGCIYLVKQDDFGIASYKLQFHEFIYNCNEETKVQIICDVKLGGLYYAIYFSMIEMQFLLEYNNMVLPIESDKPLFEGQRNNTTRDPVEAVPLADGSMPCYFPAAKLPIQIPHSKSSLRGKIYSHRRQSSIVQMQNLDEAFRMSTTSHIKLTDERRRSRQIQEPPKEAQVKAKMTSKTVGKSKEITSLDREVELMYEYFEHMALTQPTFEDLRLQEEEIAKRLNKADQVSDNFNDVYAEDRHVRETIATAKQTQFGIVDAVQPKEKVFAAEEYKQSALYLHQLGQQLRAELYREGKEAHKDAISTALEHNLYLKLAETNTLSKDEIAQLRETLVENGHLKSALPLAYREESKEAIILPKTYMSAKLPWQPTWQVAIEKPQSPDPLLPRSPKKHHSPRKSPTKLTAKEDNVLPAVPTAPPPKPKPPVDISILTNILQRQTNADLVCSPSEPQLQTSSETIQPPHRPSTASATLPSQELRKFSRPTSPANEDTTDEVVPTTLPFYPGHAAPPPKAPPRNHKGGFRRKKKQQSAPARQLKLPWSRLNKGEVPNREKLVSSVAQTPVEKDELIVVQQTPFHVVRHHNKVVALKDDDGRIALNNSKPIKPKKTPREKPPSAADALHLARVLGNERMALVWEQLSDELAWMETEIPR